jgi:S-DNA-T family DNA segregation ATPase FtsK/SpoIIIE
MAKRTHDDRRERGLRILKGAVLIPLALALMMALFSYRPTDIYFFQTPPDTPPQNLMGTVGAWTAFGLYTLLGAGAYLFSLWLITIATMQLCTRVQHVRSRAAWCAVGFLSLLGLLDLYGGLGSWWEARNITDAGGLYTYLFTRGVLVRWLAPVGAGFILWMLLLVAIVMCAGFANLLFLLRYIGISISMMLNHTASQLGDMQNRREELTKEERELIRKRRKLEREVRREQISERVNQKGRPGKEAREAKSVAKRVVHSEVPPTTEKRKRRSWLKKNDEESAADTVPTPPATPAKPAKPARKSPPRKSTPAPAAAAAPAPAEPTEPAAPTAGVLFPTYEAPNMDLLDAIPDSHHDGIQVDTDTIAALLTQTLSEFGIDAEVTGVETGPVVTRYEILPAPGIRVERIAGLANNLTLALKATSIRVQAPIPGKGVVGIEVPNEISKVVYAREILESETWTNSKAHLPLILGQDVGGKVLVADLAKMPHLLIAGATGSGKSVCMNSILGGLLMSRTPDELRLILVDPKIVEFSVYNDIPHLVVPVITDPKKVSLGLRWAITEMEKRYKMFAEVRVRNIEGFNNREVATQQDLFGEKPEGTPPAKQSDLPDKVPYIVIIIDELADLMLAAGAEIENSIARLAQLSRAVGIHMIIATQRPSVNVITGTIKANFPARIAFQVAQKVDSRTILDQSGADKLLGRGDMLFLPPSSSKLVRAQGAMLSDDEVHRLTEYVRAQAEPAFEPEIKSKLDKPANSVDSLDTGEDDDMVAQCIEILRETGRGSTSSLQRRLRIGYTRAARMMDILEERGIVGPPRGSDPREILIDLDAGIPDSSADDVSSESDSGLEGGDFEHLANVEENDTPE